MASSPSPELARTPDPGPQAEAASAAGGIIGGLLLIGLAMIVLVAPALAGGSVLFIVGLALAFTGVIEIARALRSARASGASLHIGIGVAYLLAGILVTLTSGPGAFLTSVLSGLFLVLAVFRIALAATPRAALRRRWYGVLGFAAVALLAAALTGLRSGWATAGLLVGLDLLLAGIAAIALAVTGRSERDEEERRLAELRGRSPATSG